MNGFTGRVLRRGVVLLCWVGALGLAAACGDEPLVLSGNCEPCSSGADWRTTEYCVKGYEGRRRYCAKACQAEQDCGVDQMCTPMVDQGTPQDLNPLDRWVCMPNSFFASKMNGRILRVVDNCVKGGPHPCPPNMTCMMDASEPGEAFFCTHTCRENEDCLSECCYDTSFGLNPAEKYCAPLGSYCFGKK